MNLKRIKLAIIYFVHSTLLVLVGYRKYDGKTYGQSLMLEVDMFDYIFNRPCLRLRIAVHQVVSSILTDFCYRNMNKRQTIFADIRHLLNVCFNINRGN